MIGKIVDSYKRWRRRGHLKGRRGPNFARGDHAVCVVGGDWHTYYNDDITSGPAKGQRGIVIDIGMTLDCHFIRLEGWPSRWFTADCFRKILFDKTEAHDECPDLLKLLKQREDA